MHFRGRIPWYGLFFEEGHRKLSYYVYVLRSVSTGKIYIGQTNHLLRRVEQHNDPNCTLTRYTKRNKGP